MVLFVDIILLHLVIAAAWRNGIKAWRILHKTLYDVASVEKKLFLEYSHAIPL